MNKWLYALAALIMALPLSASTPPPTVTMAFVGDVMLGSNHNGAKLPASLSDVIAPAAPMLQAADLAIGNLEGAISTHPVSGKQGCGKCYAFRMPPQAASALKTAGFDAMSIANNHARDFGDQGLIDTVKYLSAQDIGATGVAGQNAVVIKRANKTIGLLAFAPNRGMNDVRSLPLISSKVAQLKKQVDLVVVSFHIGAEGSAATRVRAGSETYLGENRGDVMAASRAAIDAGADLVFGHGPHVPRALDVYKGKLIAYSLGNFATYGGFGLDGALGYAPLLWVEFDQSNRIQCAKVVSFIQTRPGGVRLDPSNRALNLMWERTTQDVSASSPAVKQLLNATCQRWQ